MFAKENRVIPRAKGQNETARTIESASAALEF